MPRADPEHAPAVLSRERTWSSAEAGRVARVLAVMGELSARGVEEVEAAAGADPEPAVGIGQDRAHLIVGQARRLARIVAEVLEAPGLDIQAVQPAGRGADPQGARVVGGQGPDLGVREARRIRGVGHEVREALAVRVEAIEPAFAAHPEAALGVE